jgi:hypothetical protein
MAVNGVLGLGEDRRTLVVLVELVTGPEDGGMRSAIVMPFVAAQRVALYCASTWQPLAQGRPILGVHVVVALSMRQRSSSALEDGTREQQTMAIRGEIEVGGSRSRGRGGWQ